MGLRNSKQKHSKDKKMEHSVKKQIGEKKNKFTEQTPEIGDSAKKPAKQNSDVGFKIEKNENKSKIKCQINESAEVTDESDTDNEDSTKVKTKETEAPISPKISITDSSPSRSKKKRREYDFDINKWDDEECLEANSSLDSLFKRITIRRFKHSLIGSDVPAERSLPDKCRSFDNNEEQISRMDKIIAQGNIPSIPRRNRPAPAPPDLLE